LGEVLLILRLSSTESVMEVQERCTIRSLTILLDSRDYVSLAEFLLFERVNVVLESDFSMSVFAKVSSSRKVLKRQL